MSVWKVPTYHAEMSDDSSYSRQADHRVFIRAEKAETAKKPVSYTHLAPSIKPHRHTYLHEEKYREAAKKLVLEDEVLSRVLED